MSFHGTVPTVRVKSDLAPGGFYLINESDFDAAIHELHTAPVRASLPPPPPIPPKSLPEGLQNLSKDWRNKSSNWLRDLAQKATGRTPEDRTQAIQMIEAKLAE